MIVLFNIGGALHSHHVIESVLLTRKLRLVVIAFGLLSCLLQLLLALPDSLGLIRGDSLLRRQLHGGLGDGRACSLHLILVWVEIGCDLIVLISHDSANSWSLLFENWVSHHLITLSILDELLHAVANVVHLEDLRSRGPIGRVLCHEQGNELFQLLAVRVWDRLWIILHNLENQAEQVIGLKRLFQSAEFE